MYEGFLLCRLFLPLLLLFTWSNLGVRLDKSASLQLSLLTSIAHMHEDFFFVPSKPLLLFTHSFILSLSLSLSLSLFTTWLLFRSYFPLSSPFSFYFSLIKRNRIFHWFTKSKWIKNEWKDSERHRVREWSTLWQMKSRFFELLNNHWHFHVDSLFKKVTFSSPLSSTLSFIKWIWISN